MIDQLTLAEVSAVSGITGILISQALTGMFAYAGDRRKAKIELKSTFRNRQIEIAENFYYVSGEKMAVVKKNIGYWQNWNNARSEASLDFLNKEMVKLNAYLEKLDAENWKFNLVSLYFDVALTNDLLIASNDRSKDLYLKVLDVTDAFKHAAPDSKADIYVIYDEAISKMCIHYESVYKTMANDMAAVRTGLAKEFGLSNMAG